MSFEYPDIDPILNELISKLPQLPQVQYSTKDQLIYLKNIAIRLGLYDAADFLKNGIGPYHL